MYHPNIDLEGNVCLNILREDWKPVLTINSIIYGLQYLFLVSCAWQTSLFHTFKCSLFFAFKGTQPWRSPQQRSCRSPADESTIVRDKRPEIFARRLYWLRLLWALFKRQVKRRPNRPGNLKQERKKTLFFTHKFNFKFFFTWDVLFHVQQLMGKNKVPRDLRSIILLYFFHQLFFLSQKKKKSFVISYFFFFVVDSITAKLVSHNS